MSTFNRGLRKTADFRHKRLALLDFRNTVLFAPVENQNAGVFWPGSTQWKEVSEKLIERVWPFLSPEKSKSKALNRACLVSPCWRALLPARENRFNPWPGKIPTCCGETKSERPNCWACTLELGGHNYWSSSALEPRLGNKRGHRSGKPMCHTWRRAPALLNWRKAHTAAKTQHSQKQIDKH